MDKIEAREILRSYRPGTSDEQDPQVVAGLQLAKQDPELTKWLDAQTKFHAAMRSKLREIPVPEELKWKILRQHTERQGRIINLRNYLMPLATAAAIALLVVGFSAVFSGRGRNTFADYRERIVKQAERGYTMTLVSTNMTEIHSYLLGKNCPDYTLTKPLSKLAGLGCANLEWRNRKVSMVCLEATPGKDVFLFVMDDASLKNAPELQTPQFEQILRWMTVSWTDGGKVYILAGPDDGSQLKTYLN